MTGYDKPGWLRRKLAKQDAAAAEATARMQGRGEHWTVQDRQSNQVIKRALDEGWIDTRWPTDTPVDKLGSDTPKDIAVRVTVQSMLSADASVANPAVANLIKMEAQNQIDDRAPAPPVLQQFNIGGSPSDGEPISAAQGVRQLLQNPEFLEFARQKALEAKDGSSPKT